MKVSDDPKEIDDAEAYFLLSYSLSGHDSIQLEVTLFLTISEENGRWNWTAASKHNGAF